MRIATKILTILILVIMCTSVFASGKNKYADVLDKVEKQLLNKIKTFDGKWPEYTIDGKWKFRKKVNWLSGFAAGELFLMNKLSGNKELFDEAIKLSDTLLDYTSIDYTHDMGFIFLHSAVKAYNKTGDKKYKEAALTAAKMLVKRFNENGNYIRAWGKLGSEKKAGLMIIDTLMNLELLFWTAKEYGMPELYDVAYTHAVTCLNETVRADFTSYHVVEFDPVKGNVVKKFTHQGAKDESTWARGQAWGIYGFAEVYKNTGDERFLNASVKMAEYFISKLPSDHVPFWDLDLKGKKVARDASAAAIAASGMYILTEVTDCKKSYIRYKKYADRITESLVDNYTFLSSEREEQGLLTQTVYNYHKDWGINESFPCGDYYFVEAVSKYLCKNTLKDVSELTARNRYNLNQNWYYLEDNVAFERISKSSVKWQKIDLPHSWNKFDAVDQEPGYRRDASWYEKELNIETVKADKKYILDFEGSNITTMVYVNNQFAGKHVGGYVGFKIDITDKLKSGNNNILIRVDNSVDRSIIPSQRADFFIYGGINRDIWLNVLPEKHLPDFKITPYEISESSAKVKLGVDSGYKFDGYSLGVSLTDPDGEEVFAEEYKTNIVNELELPEVDNPKLWSTEVPNLYKLKVSLLKDGNVKDEWTDRIGFRWFEFKQNGPFYLNGKRLKLRGTHRHEDHAGMANALPNTLHRKDMQQIKDIGGNFVRLAHYPQDPEVYKACDELGILVWDELPWCRGGVGDEEWQATAKQLFVEQINQNYNHPSIILWSVGNEVYWLPEYEGGGDIEKLKAFTKELHDLAHKLDKTRLTSIRKFYEAADIVDVFSPSIWAGWYSGVYKSYEKAVNNAIKKYNSFFHMEYGGASHFGRHSETPITGDGLLNPDEWAETVNQVKVKSIAKIGDWSESYIVDLFDWHIMVSEKVDEFTGNAQWAFKDFGTPLRPENALPYINQKGLVDRAGNPKDAYYVFKSWWNKTDKFVYIESHTWDLRYGPEGKARNVCVFSNCEIAELFLNGKSLGKKDKDVEKFPATGLNWDVIFSEGDNELVAVGYADGKKVNDTLNIKYSFKKFGNPDRIKLTKKRLPNSNWLVTAEVVDKVGKVCTDFNERVYFSISGSGKLVENFGTYTKSSVIEFASGKASVEFKAVPFEKCTIEARTQNFKGDYLVIE